MMRLTTNFTLEELTHSQTAIDKGISNKPTAEALDNLKVLATGLEIIRYMLGNEPITLTNAYRNNAVNRLVGGVPNSDHVLGFAGDCRHSRLSPLECCRIIRDSKLNFDQLILETSRNIFHISFAPRMRRQVGEQRLGAGTPVVWRLP
jgi:zinc D-Ala-D-Ala carboxypeptidase